jgi:hypothetical protein
LVEKEGLKMTDFNTSFERLFNLAKAEAENSPYAFSYGFLQSVLDCLSDDARNEFLHNLNVAVESNEERLGLNFD